MSPPQLLARSQIDFIGGDFDALATHMRHCALAQGRWFAMGRHLQRVRSVAAGRIVTMVCVAVVLAIGLFAIV